MARPPLRLERLQLLVEAAERGSISAVARARDCTASAVSQQLSALERESGVKLLYRSSTGVTLTPVAQRVVDRVHRAASELQAAQDELRQEASGGEPAGEVHISAVASASATVVSRAVAHVTEEYPSINVHVADMEPERSLRALALGDADVAIIDEYEHVPTEPTRGLTSRRLLSEPLVLVLPPSYSHAPDAMPLEEFADSAWIAAPAQAACGEAVRRACFSAGFSPDTRWLTDDLYLSVQHVAAGHGVALLPLLVARQPGLPVVVRRVTNSDLSRHLVMVTRDDYASHGRLAPILEALRTEAKTIEAELQLAQLHPADLRRRSTD